MRVSDIMTEAAVSDQADDTLAEAAHKMWEQQTGSLIVMEGEELAPGLGKRLCGRAGRGLVMGRGRPA